MSLPTQSGRGGGGCAVILAELGSDGHVVSGAGSQEKLFCRPRRVEGENI